jgi:hypothetical protein
MRHSAERIECSEHELLNVAARAHGKCGGHRRLIDTSADAHEPRSAQPCGFGAMQPSSRGGVQMLDAACADMSLVARARREILT